MVGPLTTPLPEANSTIPSLGPTKSSGTSLFQDCTSSKFTIKPDLTEVSPAGTPSHSNLMLRVSAGQPPRTNKTPEIVSPVLLKNPLNALLALLTELYLTLLNTVASAFALLDTQVTTAHNKRPVLSDT